MPKRLTSSSKLTTRRTFYAVVNKRKRRVADGMRQTIYRHLLLQGPKSRPGLLRDFASTKRTGRVDGPIRWLRTKRWITAERQPVHVD